MISNYLIILNRNIQVYFMLQYASIIRDNGISRGYGFVHFSKEEEYQQCLKEMDGTLFHNKVMKVKEKKKF